MFRDLSLTQYYDTEEDSNSDTDSDISHALSEASSMWSYQLRKKDTAMKNIVWRNDVFHTQQLEESFKISKNYKKYGTSDRVNKKIWHNSPKLLRTKNIISEVKMMKQISRNTTEIQSNSSRQKYV